MVRRRFVSTILVTALAMWITARLGSAEEAIRLTAAAPSGEIQTVSIEVELGGELKLPATDDADVDTTPAIAAEAKLVYDESQLPGGTPRSVRYYTSVEGTANVAGRERPLALRGSRKLVIATPSSLQGVQGPLDRDELQLLRTAADSLTVGGLLPGRTIKPGDTWEHEPAEMQTLLGIDSVGVCEVTSVLIEANQHYARCQVAGTVHGVTDGTSVELEINGIYLFRRATEEVSHLNLAIRETRTIGPATPGCTTVTKVRMKREAAEDSPLTADMIAAAQRADIDTSVALELASDRLGFTTSVDPRWYVTGSYGDQLTLRRVTPEGLVAHGNLVRLDPKPLDAASALSEFRRDVMVSLADNSPSLKSESQWVNRHGCRVMAIVAVGKVEDVEVEWHCFQIAPPKAKADLHRLALSLMVESGQLERLADQDRALIEQLSLTSTSTQQATRPTRQR